MGKFTVSLFVLSIIIGAAVSGPIDVDYSYQLVNGGLSNVGNTFADNGHQGTPAPAITPIIRTEPWPAVSGYGQSYDNSIRAQAPTGRTTVAFTGATITGNVSDIGRGSQSSGQGQAPNHASLGSGYNLSGYGQSYDDTVRAQAPKNNGRTTTDFTGATITGNVSNIGRGNQYSGQGQAPNHASVGSGYDPNAGRSEVDSTGATITGSVTNTSNYRDEHAPVAIAYDDGRSAYLPGSGGPVDGQPPQVVVNFKNAKIGGSVSNIGNSNGPY